MTSYMHIRQYLNLQESKVVKQTPQWACWMFSFRFVPLRGAVQWHWSGVLDIVIMNLHMKNPSNPQRVKAGALTPSIQLLCLTAPTRGSCWSPAADPLALEGKVLSLMLGKPSRLPSTSSSDLTNDPHLPEMRAAVRQSEETEDYIDANQMSRCADEVGLRGGGRRLPEGISSSTDCLCRPGPHGQTPSQRPLLHGKTGAVKPHCVDVCLFVVLSSLCSHFVSLCSLCCVSL